MDHIDKVATASVLSVYSVAKEMIIMKKGGVSREIQATEEKLLRSLCSLCTLWQNR